MKGFLGTRGDLLSDVLIVAVTIIVPALLTAIVLVKKKRFALHRAIMMSIFFVLVLYVVIYEANLTLLGGIDYLRSNIRISEGPYFALVAFHITLSAAALILGSITMRRGEAVLCSGQIAGLGFTSAHRKLAWIEVVMLVISVFTGLAIYYFTFVY
ncbi:MAG: hypothetical protein A2X87_04255 [Deltaproteobacteria bacterium GWC2_42_51]|nr:MAG: hypothetical protein A2067_07630 [Deltaproteobacteria bacterium GWB2_42_7]OGP37022.1 MAG: hypothetical protein A2X87_04255 [Deltaproteobacteria bacterium GWC2_42_51]OGP39057.1 MAG: hypothetical protein A2090_06700 [Deltaproteobacteria bacterium GWD2_42_10]OGP47311.1 MAG: hypothetical protein A2022_10965 [Deltaproteobacteria bacterium GWF2_42_12]OGQ24237.1 MAG: hypothetical protein A3D29_00395 [Deltaproteobacteria bacterium RIFCSPHIGHO2_02_FULL_42_44]OGQ36274.1 MAG: hypothetical protein